MESDLAIFASQMHNIKVRYHIVGKQEELQEIYDLYQTFIQKERPAMEEDEADDWEGNIILALGVDYGTCNLCGNIKKCELSEGFLYIEAEELALITDPRSSQKSFQGFGNLFRYRRSRKRNICD